MAMSVAEVMGAEAKKLRVDAKKSLEDVAKAVESYGLPWSTGRVGDFENGRAAPDLRTLFAFAAALGDVVGRPVSLADLFAGKGPVRINDKLSVDLAVLRAALSDKAITVRAKRDVVVAPAPAVLTLTGASPAVYTRVRGAFKESDERMCKRIGVELNVGAAAMAKLWGKTFVARRDELAGPDANAQRRGQISRQLQTELKELFS